MRNSNDVADGKLSASATYQPIMPHQTDTMKKCKKEAEVGAYYSTRLDSRALLNAGNLLTDIPELLYGKKEKTGFYEAFAHADYQRCEEIRGQIIAKFKEVESREGFFPKKEEFLLSLNQDDLTRTMGGLGVSSEEAAELLLAEVDGDYREALKQDKRLRIHRCVQEARLIVSLTNLGVSQLLHEAFYDPQYNQHNLQSAY
ncbi:hypothetical protein HON22_05020, partial [Candidatus Peregrinibacteria bacterium]|nr:hypothetical protein [Candidatus Peregrinibacteria bacterium]